MYVETHEKDNTTTHLDDGIQVNRNRIGVSFVSTIFDKDGFICSASGFYTEKERESWIETQLAVIRHMNIELKPRTVDKEQPLLEF